LFQRRKWLRNNCPDFIGKDHAPNLPDLNP